MIPNFFKPPVRAPIFGPRPGMMPRFQPGPINAPPGGMPMNTMPINPGGGGMPMTTMPVAGPGNDIVNLGPPGSPIPTGAHGQQLAGEGNPAMQPGNIGDIAAGRPSNLGGDIVNLGPPGFNQGTNHGPQSAGPTSPSLQDLRTALTHLHLSQAMNRMGKHNAAHGAAWGQ